MGLLIWVTAASFADDTTKTSAERLMQLRDILQNLETNKDLPTAEKDRYQLTITSLAKNYLDESGTRYQVEAPGVFKLSLQGNRYFNALAGKIADLTSIQTIKIAPQKMNNLNSWFAYFPKDEVILVGPKAFVDDVPDSAISDLIMAVIQDKSAPLKTNYNLSEDAFANPFDFPTIAKQVLKLETRKNKNINFKNNSDKAFLGNYLMISAYTFLQNINDTYRDDKIELATAGLSGAGYISFAGDSEGQHYLNLLISHLLNDEDLEIEQVIYDPQNLKNYFADWEYDANTKTLRLGHEQILTTQTLLKNANKAASTATKTAAAIKKAILKNK